MAVDGGTVTSDLASIMTEFENYGKEITGLAGSWKGASYDGLKEKAENFSSTFSSTIKGEMEALANAANKYNDEYIPAKRAKENAESAYAAAERAYNTAAAKDPQDTSGMSSASDDMAKAKTEIDENQKKMDKLKPEIEALLKTAASGKL